MKITGIKFQTMSRRFVVNYFWVILIASFINCILTSCQSTEETYLNEIKEEFRTVPDSVKPWTYWYWISDNISKDGITRDLEAMAEIGIGTALIGNIGLENVPAGDIKVLSEEWWQMMRWAVREGRRTGIDIGIFNCPGWSQSGGPWITNENTMRYLAHENMRVVGPASVRKQMDRPAENFQQISVLAYPARTLRSNPINGLNRDIHASTNLKEVNKIFDGNMETSCMFGTSEMQDSLISVFVNYNEEIEPKSLIIHPSNVPIYARIRFYDYFGNSYRLIKESIIDRMNPQIIVGFEPYAPIALALPEIKSKKFKVEIEFVPSPRNTLLKGGLNEIELSEIPVVEYYKEKQLAKMNQTPWFNGTEYLWPEQEEVDAEEDVLKINAIIDITDNVDNNGLLQWEVPEGEWIIQQIGMTPTKVTNHPTLPHATGPEVDKMNQKAVQHHFDSYLGKFWESLPEEDRAAFKVVYVDSYETGSQNWTDEMKAHFIEAYGYNPIPWLPVLSGTVVEGVDQSNRFLWDLRRLIANLITEKYVKGLKDASNDKGLIFGLENVGHWGFPGETLLYGKYTDFQAGEFWNEGPLGNWENRIASSTAHIYGKNKVYCESFTAGGLPFQRSPMNLKKRGDWSYTEGINQTMLHLHIQQPNEALKPGINAGFGTEFNRHNTWYFMAKPWINYLRRNNYLLQQGNYVADVAYFYGEDAPKLTGYQNIPLPSGYSFDYINADVIMNHLDVHDGRFILPDGMSYKILVLPDSKTMRPELLEKLADLVAKGGAIIGNQPERSPSLQNYPECDLLVDSLASILWGNMEKDYTNYGKGTVFKKTSLESVFESLGVSPDVSFDKEVPVLWTHRNSKGIEIYFLTNQGNNEINFNATFRVKGRKPSWWSAIDGSIRDLPEFENTVDGNMKIPIRLGPLESGFVVWTEEAGELDFGHNFPEYEMIQQIDNEWSVSFTDPFGEQFDRKFAALEDWSKSEEKQLKYFSGNAIYKTEFDWNRSFAEEACYLNLGKIGVTAKVSLNGNEIGGLWTFPWRIDISDYLKEGSNTLTIEVANNWNNRMAGDASLEGKERKSYASVDIFKPEAPLQSSGLMGPVVIEKIANKHLTEFAR